MTVCRIATVAAVAVRAALVIVVIAGSACRDDAKKPAAPAVKPAVSLPIDAGVQWQAERTAIESVQIKVVDPTDGPVREVFPRLLAQRFGATLADSDWFLSETATPPPGVRRRPGKVLIIVGYSVVPEGSAGTPAIIAVVEAELLWSDRRNDGLAMAMNLLAERPLSKAENVPSKLDGLVAEHVEQAVADAARAFVIKERIRVGPDAEAIGALETRDEDVRIWALSVVRERRIADAFDAVIARLGSDNDAERDAAIGALMGLRDPRAIGPLTKRAEFQDYVLMRLVIDAVAHIGGREAVEYLEFVATGHPDADIVRQATAALERAKRPRDR